MNTRGDIFDKCISGLRSQPSQATLHVLIRKYEVPEMYSFRLPLYISDTLHLFFMNITFVLNDHNIHLYSHVPAPEIHLCCRGFCNVNACWIYIQLNMLLYNLSSFDYVGASIKKHTKICLNYTIFSH
jgi:hypothetical protein